MSDVKMFGAVGDGRSDDTAAIEHAVHDGDGLLEFPRGRYLVRRTIEVPLTERGATAVSGSGGTATVVMAGAGPALRLIGSHSGTGDPGSVRPEVRLRERRPTVKDIEITGSHDQADGIELPETMQPILEGLLLRSVRHGIRLHRRNRNVLICNCQIYHNTGVGVYLDGVNLHQINITGNHISYNRLGGIRIERSEVRNLQITGNDIEYNNHRAFDTTPEPTAEIYIDVTADGASVNEVAVNSNTIQATPSPGGANVRILEKPGTNRPPGLWTLTGNIIGNQHNNVHLSGCHGVVLSGNFIYSCVDSNLLLEECSQINVTGNSFRRHTPTLNTGILLRKTQDCVLSGCTVQDESPEGQASGASLIELEDCRRINIQGCQLLDGAPFGIDAQRCEMVNITGCTIDDTRPMRRGQGAVRFRGRGRANLLAACSLGDFTEPVQAPAEAKLERMS